MYAIAFDLVINDLKKEYGESYSSAYYEIKEILKIYGFHGLKGSSHNNLAEVYKAINTLSKTIWFKKSVRDIRAFKVEDWSDFTDIVKS